MYGPVNVPGAAGVDLEEITNAVKTWKAAFPVVAADPENPEQGDAWILTGQS